MTAYTRASGWGGVVLIRVLPGQLFGLKQLTVMYINVSSHDSCNIELFCEELKVLATNLTEKRQSN